MSLISVSMVLGANLLMLNGIRWLLCPSYCSDISVEQVPRFCLS